MANGRLLSVEECRNLQPEGFKFHQLFHRKIDGRPFLMVVFINERGDLISFRRKGNNKFWDVQ